ncbi:winged helix-turn-helix transcriptional regulator [Halegenticoccus tardaugens]|uniref:winged helix-turn-helix transcriptional regulator n=1 Tax=Halegenticoccus tardaugens TaxID=2071624 RepID=UPI00100AF30F|nr:helix-turn-helix domain-containing protein [Halegenticoccus tardaugens]
MERSTHRILLVSVIVALVLVSAVAPIAGLAVAAQSQDESHQSPRSTPAERAVGPAETAFDAPSIQLSGTATDQPDPGVQLAASSSGSVDGGFEPALTASGERVSPPGIVLLLGYSRYDGSSPLDNPVRRQVYDTIADSPGAYVSDIAERCETPRSTVRYHIKVLERERLVFGEKIRGKQRFFPAGAEEVELTAALDDEAAASVLDAVARTAPATVSQVAEEVDRTPGTVSHHLSRLEEAGLIEQERSGGAVLNRLATDVLDEDGPIDVRIEAAP